MELSERIEYSFTIKEKHYYVDEFNRKQGIQYIYFDDGSLSFIVNFVNNYMHGRFISYTIRGDFHFDQYIIDEMPEGEQLIYF